MGEPGDGNIKVVVRCRPLNSRGACNASGDAPTPIGLTICRYQNMQSWVKAQSRSFGWRGTRPFSTRLRQARLRPPQRPGGQPNARPSRSRLTRATGRLDRRTSPDIAVSKLCLMIWAKNSWIMRSAVSMHVSWHVRVDITVPV
jgi:hypothetical protein